MYCTNEKLTLASGSPRRKQYLLDVGIQFEVNVAGINEEKDKGEFPLEYVSRMSVAKAKYVMEKCPDRWVISADTIVFIDNEVLGKPIDRIDALKSIMKLMGRTHKVATSFSLGCGNLGILYEKTVVTEVTFSTYSESIAKKYVETGESYDKAGAYGIQGKGAFLVSGVNGSYSNVVGLPLSEVVTTLLRFKVISIAD